MYRLTLLLLFLLPLSAFPQAQDSLSINTLTMDTLTVDSVVAIPEYDLLEELSQPTEDGGNVELHAAENIQNMLKWHVRQNKQKRSFTGYRIQLYSVNSYGCDINRLKEFGDKLELDFSDIPAYLKYFDPDFKIRAGNYHSRLESIPALYRIRKLHPSCYPVKTEITLEDLKRIPLQDIPKEEPPIME